jgi:hypothetical protein
MPPTERAQIGGFAAAFAGFGALYGLVRGDGLLLGTLAGLLLFGMVFGVGSLFKR